MLPTQAEWNDIANKTFQRWHFPNCFVATDWNHIPLMHPYHSGSQYINYKEFSCIMFLFVDISCQGCISDGVVF